MGPLSRWAAVVFLLLAVSILPRSVGPYLGNTQGPELPPFELVDQSGSIVTLQSLLGRPWIVAFIYTSCPGPCPRVVERMKQLRKRIGSSTGLDYVLLSVDPDTDTPEVLSAYAAAHGLSGRQWKLLTGDRGVLTNLVRHGFLLGIERRGTGTEEAGKRRREGPILHSLKLVLVDKRGTVRGYYDSSRTGETATLVRDAALLRLELPAPTPAR